MATTGLKLRVNGLEISKITIRSQIIHGAPVGNPEIVVTDPIIGNFALDDNQDIPFIIELKEGKVWKIVNVADLLTIVESVGGISTV